MFKLVFKTKKPVCFSQLPFYVQMLILMTMFLVIVVYHARLVEVTSRLDFLWKLQAETDLKEMKETQRTNRHLLKHILPDHVVKHFLSKDRCPDVRHEAIITILCCGSTFLFI